ncbi:trans-homoaconitate synthase [Candidatus Omnitrophus magneticus]|uniref:Trans-homoaconitate synthase n=1 Tax=Candidatus Omnitrophus magneticus TaxID=1609969 RepID=A0A0F0CRH5_9BACT|nr:trans-homoaconitate synthase [Candidatus Omnitrophus magneticus]
MIEILDSTLREGEQSRDVSFSLEQKIELASLLDEFGVDFIEVGHPVVSEQIRDDVHEICSIGLRANVITHARAKIEDVKAAKDCSAKWVGIFIGVNDMSLRYKYNVTMAQVHERIRSSIGFAKDKEMNVRLTIEDATRTELNTLLEAIHIAISSGADRISIADTVGVATPIKFYNLIKRLKDEIETPLHVHCHNDLGMASANAIAAYEAGINLIDVSINGLGERTGIASLAEICTALDQIFEVPNLWRLDMLNILSEKTTLFSNVPMCYKMPIVGRDAFHHKSKLHIKAAAKHPSCYNPVIIRDRSFL